MLYKQGDTVQYGIKEFRFGTKAEFTTVASSDNCLIGSTALIATDTDGAVAVYMKTASGLGIDKWVKL